MFTSPTVIWSDVMMQEPRLFSRRRKRTRQRLSYATKPPWGVCVFLAFQSYAVIRPRIWPWLLNAASPNSATVQDQRLGSSLVFDTIFSIFCLTVMGNVWKHGLCDFERPGACWISLTDGSVSSKDCRPRLTQTEDAEGKMAVVFERRAFTLVQSLDLKGRPSLFPAHVSVSFWDMASHVCECYLGARMLCFCFHLLPCHHSPVCTRTNVTKQ